MSQLCLALHAHRRLSVSAKKAQKIAARMISLEIYAQIRNQKWKLQDFWLAYECIDDGKLSCYVFSSKHDPVLHFEISLSGPYRNTVEAIKAVF